MFTRTITPIFCDTDALGHISNTIIPNWFESARDPLFRYFSPDLNPKTWQLILASYEVQFLSELFYGYDVEIRTYLSKLGNSSMHISQQVWQNGVMAVKGKTVIVHFDYQQKKARPIPMDIKMQLREHLIEDEP